MNVTPVPSENPLISFPKQRCWAVVGVSDHREKYGNIIFRALRDAGYRVYAIHPKLTEVEGHQVYQHITDLPEVPDVVDFVIPPQAVPPMLHECATHGVKRVWFQPGSESPEALALAASLGLQAVSDACILIQQQQWDEDAV
ncbi:MAG: CoA-binding protein [Vampirovibrionales bacterium]